MKLSEFDFELPADLIATRPVRPRSSARMLVVGPDKMHDARAGDLAAFLRPGDRLILNDTRVLAARLSGRRTRISADQRSDARIEVTLLEPTEQGYWGALIKPLRKLREGEVIRFSDDFSARLVAKKDGIGLLQFEQSGAAFDAALAAHGVMPLPPYIAAKRAADARDDTDYQTIWANRAGAVAAPTASLHFDAELLRRLAAAGVQTSRVTLHVGAGTFLPVKTDDISEHKMHSERGEISAGAAREMNRTRAAGGRLIAVGTTALRLIETAADAAGKLQPWQGDTDIFIKPGFNFRATDALMTNFHLPRSTLLMLVSAFMGTTRMRAVYGHAIAARYRFFSYGDASLLLPQRQSRPD